MKACKDLTKADELLKGEFLAGYPGKSYDECIAIVNQLSDELKAWAKGKYFRT